MSAKEAAPAMKPKKSVALSGIVAGNAKMKDDYAALLAAGNKYR